MMTRVLALALLSALVSGCYVLQAASGQWEVMRRSRPIEQVLADPATPAATRRGLELTREARAFAERELDLPESRSYRHYADLGRPFVVWNVDATPEFSVAPRRWCFPVAGCVSYRGYFRETAARDHALRLASRGDDVSVGGVPTYSTLGHLPDPVFDAMLGYQIRGLPKDLKLGLQLNVTNVLDDEDPLILRYQGTGVRRYALSAGREWRLAANLEF